VRARELRKRLTRFRREERGAVIVEFLVWFPLFFGLLTSSFELGFLLTRQALLERAVDVTMREVRVGIMERPSHEDLKERICAEPTLVKDCANALLLEMRPVDIERWDLPDAETACVDRESQMNPSVAFNPGRANELMLVRACAIFDPFLPLSSLAAAIKQDASGGIPIYTTSAFVNEP
jgi:Flp pilus assembly protein TadG